MPRKPSCRPVSPDTIPEALAAEEAKKRKRGRKARARDERVLSSPRRLAFVLWLCLAMLLGGASVGALFWLRGERPDEEKGGKGMTDRFTNEIGMKLVRIPPGTFKMGSPDGEAHRKDDEKQHEVEITRAFWVGVHKVTQKQFKDVMGYNPSCFSTDGTGKPGATYDSQPASGKYQVAGKDTSEFPVENVSWEEAKEFCEKLTEREKTKLPGRSYRLPTEAEWEYSCRGGAPSYQVFHFGNSLSSTQANFNGRDPYGGAAKGPNLQCTCKVGSYPANGFGLYDMHGNVYEWCSDWYEKNYYAVSPRQDPQGPEQTSARVLRGGGWPVSGRHCRSALRGLNEPGKRYRYNGFRLAAVPSLEPR